MPNEINKMKYKAGDKVKIRKNLCLKDKVESEINNLKSNRVVTIKKIEVIDDMFVYALKEIRWKWREDLLEEMPKGKPITNRFEILDNIHFLPKNKEKL